ncbi:aldolase [Plutella xylostella]|uniref:Fructose-bisphosphate aldolase n=1 Tax=Plutella xylostella TaxID=51655 RepID=A0ABQ7QDZ9_PLUXY|nr:aldolase [Plutella xylostella]
MTTHFSYLDPRLQEELRRTAEEIVAPGKGILACDEGNDAIGKHLEGVGLKNTDENRRKYRQLLFTTKGLSSHISAIILHESTVYQKADDETPFPELLRRSGIIPGVKVDRDVVPLFLSEDEVTTQGLDNLAQTCAKFKKLGCRFAKWRAPLKIGLHTPSPRAIRDTATVLARYAAVCQSEGLVPIVEPDVLIDGSHGIGRTQKVTEVVLAAVYKALSDHHVYLEGTLLKPNMVTSGQACPIKSSPAEVGLATVTAFRRTIPAAVPGIVFLSGGQSEEDATLNLNAINQASLRAPLRAPWVLSFSFGRAMQQSVWSAWAGRDANVQKAQMELLKRAKANSDASLGKYTRGAATAAASRDNFSRDHRY